METAVSGFVLQFFFVHSSLWISFGSTLVQYDQKIVFSSIPLQQLPYITAVFNNIVLLSVFSINILYIYIFLSFGNDGVGPCQRVVNEKKAGFCFVGVSNTEELPHQRYLSSIIIDTVNFKQLTLYNGKQRFFSSIFDFMINTFSTFLLLCSQVQRDLPRWNGLHCSTKSTCQ